MEKAGGAFGEIESDEMSCDWKVVPGGDPLASQTYSIGASRLNEAKD